MSRPTPRLLLLGGALLTTVALAACTSPYGDRDPAAPVTSSESPSPDLSASQNSPNDPGDTRPTDPTEVNGGSSDVGLGESSIGLPAGVTPDAGLDVVAGAGWSSDGATLYVTTYGSSSCPQIPVDLVAADGTITIELYTAGGAVCTADFTPTTTAVPAGPGLTSSVTQTVVLGDLGSTDLPPAADPVAFGWVEAPAG